MTHQPTYYGILPAHVRYSKALKPMQKILFTEITALSNSNGHCTASNGYFAELYEVDKKTVGRWIKGLEKHGFVDVVADPITGHNRTITPRDKKITPLGQKDHPPRDKKITHNNTSIILQDNNKGKSENLPSAQDDPEDKFTNLPDLKGRIGPKHYELLNKACSDEPTYQALKGIYKDGRFDLLVQFLEYRKETRRTYKSVSGIRRQIETFSEYTFHEMKLAVDDCIRNGNQGIFPKKNRGKVKPMFSKKKAL